MAGKLNVLAIHHSRQLRRQLETWSEKLRYVTYLAEGKVEGLAVMYKLQPDLILLEIIVDQDDSWQLLSAIRLFTDIPLVLIADRIPDTRPELLAVDNSLLLVQPISAAKLSLAVNAVLAASGARARRGSPDDKPLRVASYKPKRAPLRHRTAG